MIPNVAEKKYSVFDGGKKKYDSEFLSYNVMLNSGEKKNILTLVLSEKKILNKTNFHNPPPPPFKLNGRSLIYLSLLGGMVS